MASQFTKTDVEQAKTLYEAQPTDIAQQFLDLLIDSPEVMQGSEAIQKKLEIADHRDVARTAYKLGVLAGAMDRYRPWTEGQKGYVMSPEIAALFAEVRSSQ